MNRLQALSLYFFTIHLSHKNLVIKNLQGFSLEVLGSVDKIDTRYKRERKTKIKKKPRRWFIPLYYKIHLTHRF